MPNDLQEEEEEEPPPPPEIESSEGEELLPWPLYVSISSCNVFISDTLQEDAKVGHCIERVFVLCVFVCCVCCVSISSCNVLISDTLQEDANLSAVFLLDHVL